MEGIFIKAVEDGFDTNARKESPKCFHLFNCDKTYSLDSVEKLLCDIKDDIRKKLSIDIELPIRKNYFPIHKMSEICETTIPKLQMDFAVFVVHAHESRLSINEDNAGIGYARFYKALLKATDERVFIVIGGDDQYSDKNEEERSVISRWARRKLSSQFQEEFMDGRKSFIFSWNKQHREIHEEALLHYFDLNKKGQKFQHQPKNPSEVSTRGKENEAENENIPGECDNRYREQEVEDSADRRAESSSSVEMNRQAPEMPVLLEQRLDVEDDMGMPEEETQLHSLPGFVCVDIPKEQFEVVDKPDATNTEVEAAANNTGVQPETHKTEVETLLVKTRLRYGQLSDSDDEKVVWEEQWTPPDELLSDISDRFKNVAEAGLEIYRVEETGAIRVKIIHTTRKSLVYAIIEIFSNVITWIMDNTLQIIQWARGSEAELKEAVVAEHSDEGFAVVEVQK